MTDNLNPAPPKPAPDAMDNCPRCGSSAPHMHPAVQHEGEVELCTDEFHLRPTNQNTSKYIAAVEAKRALSAPPPPADGPETRLPCDVHLPPNTYIRKGCMVETLMGAIAHREKYSDADREFVIWPAPSGTGAAEPVARDTNMFSRLADEPLAVIPEGYSAPLDIRTAAEIEFDRKAAKAANLPVRGDREALTGLRNSFVEICRSTDMKSGSNDPYANRIANEAIKQIDAILSLPVQPTARLDREAFYTILKKYIPQESIDEAWQELKEADPVQPGAGEQE